MNLENENCDFLITDKDYVYSLGNDQDSELFETEDSSLVLDYSFSSGNMTLYKNLGADRYLLLCECTFDENGDEFFQIFSDYGIFSSSKTQDNNFFSVLYTDYEKYNELFFNPQPIKSSKNPIIAAYREYKFDSRVFNSSKVLVYNYMKTFDNNGNNLFNNFKSSYIQYNLGSRYIVASSLIDEILEIINNYIVSGKLDKENLYQNYSNLLIFKDMCNSSISVLTPLIRDPENADLRTISDTLSRNSKNISNLIDLYLENDLNKEICL